jgi:hypothetical protein
MYSSLTNNLYQNLFRNSFFVISIIFLLAGYSGCKNSDVIRPNSHMPDIILWAWERPEDLTFIDTNKVGVAFLAQTLLIENDEVNFRPRRQKLDVKPDTYLIAVTRIETNKDHSKRPDLSTEQKNKSVNFIKNSLKLPNVRAIQIDFDVVVSEREFYKSLVKDLKTELPKDFPLTITSLASWCIGDTWFTDFPIDEAVPMAFEMGADDKKIRKFLADGNDWNERLCRGSYGISVDDPLKIKFLPNRRFFYFNNRSWQQSDLQKLER